MQTRQSILVITFFSFMFLPAFIKAQQTVNWTNNELLAPADLAVSLKDTVTMPAIFCVGPGAIIPHSIDIGMVKEEENLTKFKQQLNKLSKSANIVVYCGCCPYEHCPNIRPAVAALKSLGFTNFHLLDLPTNIKTDWISKGYPTKH